MSEKPTKPKRKAASPKKERGEGKAPKPPKVERKKAAKQPRARKEKAPKEEKKAEETKVEEKVVVMKEVAPKAPVPVPSVRVRHDASMKLREARGFSMPEMSSAGLSLVSARRWGVPFDRRRKTLLIENAESLKAWLQAPRGAESSTRKGKARKKA